MPDIIAFIETIGYLGLFLVIFAESGIFFAFFLPGDSLLFTAGFLASQGYLNFPILALTVFVAAILGDSVGYAFGKKTGHLIFSKENSFFFHKDNLKKTEQFYIRYGNKAVVLARFLPILRTFVPILAGVGKMSYRTFFTYNIIGGILWALGVSSAGYFLGSKIPNIERYLSPIIIGIVIISILPLLKELFHKKKHNKNNTSSCALEDNVT